MSDVAKLFSLGAWAYLIALDQILPVVHRPRVPDAALHLTERRTVAEEDLQLRPVSRSVCNITSILQPEMEMMSLEMLN